MVEGTEGTARLSAAASHPGVAERVDAIIAAAQQAAEQILAEARRDADEIRRGAEDETAKRVSELTLSAERTRAEADEYASDTRARAASAAASHPERRGEGVAFGLRLGAFLERLLELSDELA